MAIREKIGRTVHDLRKARKLSQEELALRVGTTGANISRYERGQQMPGAETLDHLLEELRFELVPVLQTGEPVGEYTVAPGMNERDKKMLEGFRALPEAFQVYLLGKLFQLEHYVGDITSMLRAHLRGPTPDNFRTWEKDLQNDLERKGFYDPHTFQSPGKRNNERD